MTEKGRAIWLLAILSPVVAELLSGSSPPREFFLPPNFALLVGLYGAGVLVVRELSVKWNVGWVSTIVMGLAYGILEEGVAVKSFFDPEWMDLGGLGIYGRFIGTNWVWTIWLTIFHSMISITLPIFIFGILYPGLRNERLLSGKQFKTVLVILFIDVLICSTLLNNYEPFVPMYLLAIASVIGLFLYAKHIPRDFLMRFRRNPTWPPWAFLLYAPALMFVLFSIVSDFVNSGITPIVPSLLLIIVSGLAFFTIVGRIGSVNNLQQKVYLACGFLAFWVVFDIILTMTGWLDMALCGVVTTLAIIDFTRWSKGKQVFVFHVFRLLHGPPATPLPWVPVPPLV